MNLIIAKTELFNAAQCDFWTNENNEVFMTTEQLGVALGYSQPKAAIGKLLDRNEYLSNQEFSGVTKLTTPSGGTQMTRIFTEDGIYEVTMLSKTEKAKEFRQWVRQILKELRKPKILTDHQQRIELLKLSLEHEEKFVEYDGRLSKLEDNVRIDSFEQNALQKQIKKRVYKVFETANPNGLDLKKLFPCIHRNFRDAFGVPTYKDLRKLDYEEAVSWVSTWRPLI